MNDINDQNDLRNSTYIDQLKEMQDDINEIDTEFFDTLQYSLLTDEDLEIISEINYSLNDISELFQQKNPNIIYSALNAMEIIDQDPRLGNKKYDDLCPTCNKYGSECQGHYCTIELPFYICNPNYGNQLSKLLNCICLNCAKIKFELSSEELKGIPKKKRIDFISNKFFKYMLSNKNSNFFCNECSEKFSSTGDMLNKKFIIGSGVIQTTVDAIKFKYNKVKYNKYNDAYVLSAVLYTKEKSKYSSIKLYRADNLEFNTVLIDYKKIYELLSKANIEDYKIFGLENNHPKYMIMKKLLVIPPIFRTTLVSGNDKYLDTLTRSYSGVLYTIIRYLADNTQLDDIMDAEKVPIDLIPNITQEQKDSLRKERVIISDFFEAFSNLKKKANIYNGLYNLFNAKVPKNLSEYRENLSELSLSFRERLDGKFGLLRRVMMGKRVNYTARSVVGPSPELDVNEVGVPKFIAESMSVRVMVNNINYEFILDLQKNNKLIAIIKIKNKKESRYPYNANIPMDIKIGDMVERQLMDGDYVLANRNPTIQKQGMMGLRVKVIDEYIFRLNLALTPPFNADFDGDELNIHVPQSLQAISELATFVSAEGCYANQQSSGIMVGLVFDAITGSFIISQDFIYIPYDLFNNIIFSSNIPNDHLIEKNFYGKSFVMTKNKLELCIVIVFINICKYLEIPYNESEFVYEIKKLLSNFEQIYSEIEDHINYLFGIYKLYEIYIENDYTIDDLLNNNIEIQNELEKYGTNISDLINIIKSKQSNYIIKLISLKYDIGDIEEKYLINQDILNLISERLDKYNKIDIEYKNIMNLYLQFIFFKKIQEDQFVKDIINNNVNKYNYLLLFLDKMSYYYDLKYNLFEFDKNKQDDQNHHFDKCLKYGIDILSGKSLFSLIIPNMDYIKTKSSTTELEKYMYHIKIKNGILYQGLLNKDHVGPGTNSIPHILNIYYDSTAVSKFLTYAQRLINKYLMYEGFTIGVHDCTINDDIKEYINDKIQKIRNNAYLLEQEKEKEKDEYEYEKEEKVISSLQNIQLLNKTLVKSLDIRSPLLIMAELAKAKGKGSNLIQIMASIGQQYYSGKRIKNETPYYDRNDPDPMAKGLCINSFIKGMTPSEFIYHMYSSREGMIEGAIKTGDCGAMHHQIAKVLEVLNVRQDKSVRNVQNRIIQYVYGEDGFDAGELDILKIDNFTSKTFINVDRLSSIFNTKYGF